jgi:hypothetical protein
MTQRGGGWTKLHAAWLLMKKPVELRGFPPFRQKKGERMGHGDFWACSEFA